MTRGSSKEPFDERREDPPSGVGLADRPDEGPPVAAGEESAAMESVARRVREITRENERLFQELLTGERRFRKLARAVWRVQEDERRRLARELHDGIGQTLTALKNQLEWLQRGQTGDGELGAQLTESVGMAAQALNDTRELSRLLRPAVLDDLGLAAALGWLGRTVTQRTGLEVDLELVGLDGRLDTEVETLVFRVVQEALNNVVKHSGTDRAEVSVRRQGRQLALKVSDRGRGFDPLLALGPKGAAEGVGLRGIQDRAELFDGRLRIDSRPGEGAVLEITLPLPRETEEDSP